MVASSMHSQIYKLDKSKFTFHHLYT